ncbi:MAG TPA: hypothetical protein VGF59_28700 [Bryobacteraceae bacterium]
MKSTSAILEGGLMIHVALAAGLFAQISNSRPPNEEARREQVMQWSVTADPAACHGLERALTDPAADIRVRAATALYGRCDREASARRAAPAICRSLEMGNASAGAILLLGYAPREQAEPCLTRPFPKGSAVKGVTSSRPVRSEFAAIVPLAKLGNEKALAALRAAFDKPTVAEGLFLLSVLHEVNDAEALRASVGLLRDERTVPSARADATRKMRDAAVDALADRLGLKLSFQPQTGQRFTPAEVTEVNAAALAAIAQGAKK